MKAAVVCLLVLWSWCAYAHIPAWAWHDHYKGAAVWKDSHGSEGEVKIELVYDQRREEEVTYVLSLIFFRAGEPVQAKEYYLNIAPKYMFDDDFTVWSRDAYPIGNGSCTEIGDGGERCSYSLHSDVKIVITSLVKATSVSVTIKTDDTTFNVAETVLTSYSP